jgi:D-alanyl-lipoteichoic acid acyltransferase DltB (MBOAT superfamily)
MLFNSVHYFIFAPVAIFVFFAIPDRFRRWWLLIVSLYFYAAFRVPFLFILFFSIVVTYYATRAIAASNEPSRKRLYLLIAIFGNLGILYFFKYIDFSFRIFNLVFRLRPCDDLYLNMTGVIMPIGISFFTLQAIAYAIDVYRKEIAHHSSIFDFTLFLTFFPQLVAGPIMRAKDLIYQFSEKKLFSSRNLKEGLGLIVLGLIKKTLIGDQAGLIVDQVYGDPSQYSWGSIWIGVIFFAFQVYGDFSGYSDVAIGTGLIMGFNIPQNFRRPFMAVNITDLWRRWHISLSTWLRDYIYIPLGGSRVSVPRFYVNMFITWIVTGIWHGADWTFVFWGATQTLFIATEKIAFSFGPIRNTFERLPAVLRMIYSVFLFSFGLFFFRARPTAGHEEGIGTAFEMIERAFTGAQGIGVTIPPGVVAAIAGLLLGEYLYERENKIFEGVFKRPILFYGLTGTILAYCFILYSVTVSPQFIYFQF